MRIFHKTSKNLKAYSQALYRIYYIDSQNSTYNKVEKIKICDSTRYKIYSRNLEYPYKDKWDQSFILVN